MPSKLGVHINAITHRAGQLSFFDCQPVVGKILQHDRAFVQEALGRSPKTLMIGRVYRSLDDQRKLIAAREAGAESFFRIIEGQGTFGLIKVWEGLNEIGPHPTHDYLRFELRLAELLHQAGMKYVAGSWSMGCPAIEDWQSNWILEVLRVADYIGVHEYCAPRMDTEFQLYANDAAFRARHDKNDPVPIVPQCGGFFTLRYRRWYPHLPRDCKKPVLITETGIDSGACPHGYEHLLGGKQGGWRSFTNPLGYLPQLQWYDSFLQEDAYVVGATIYCDGTADPTWASFNVREMAKMIADYIRSQQSTNFDQWLSDHAQQFVIPFVPDTKFRQVALSKGWEAISDERDVRPPGCPYDVRFQVFVSKVSGKWWQHIIWARVGDWENWKVIDRPN